MAAAFRPRRVKGRPRSVAELFDGAVLVDDMGNLQLGAGLALGDGVQRLDGRPVADLQHDRAMLARRDGQNARDRQRNVLTHARTPKSDPSCQFDNTVEGE